MTKAVVGLYDDLSTARKVTQDLEKNGFSRDDINLFETGENSTRGQGKHDHDISESLTGIGLPRQEASTYAEGVRRGGSLIAATVADERAGKAAEIMEQHVPVDINQRQSMWRQQGWTEYDRTAKPYSAEESRKEREQFRSIETQGGEATIPVVEEEMQVGKRQVQRGGARIHTHVIERPVEEQVRLREEHVEVERRPVNRPVSNADQAFREESFEVTETAEQPVVQKRARVIEEVVIHKEVGEHTETVRDTVRRTDVDVEQSGSERAVGQTGFRSHESEFHQRYNNNLAQSGYSYDEIAPVYRYGYSLGNDTRYNTRNWSQVEPEARRMWEEHNPGTWDQFKGEIKYAWQQASGRK